MEKKIRKRFLLMGLCGIVLTFSLCATVFYAVFSRQTREDLQITAQIIAEAYAELGNEWCPALCDVEDLRITLIDHTGLVLYDNQDPGEIGDHLQRPEVQDALENGAGMGVRTSETTGKVSYYYALLLQDGPVLRLSADMESRWHLFTSAMPALILCGLLLLALGTVLSILLTRQLVRPILRLGEEPDKVDCEAPYPELKPFVEAIARDRVQRQADESMRQEFTANVSHELKTPLTSISGYAELIESGMARPEDVPHFAGKIHKESQRLLCLVNDIIELTRLDATEDELVSKARFESIDLYDIAASCAERLAVNAQHAYVTLLFAGSHVTVRGDRAMLEELCLNLCDNAIRYNRPGGKVTVSCGVADRKPFLRVLDDGIGIPEEEQERVYERFYRVDKSRSKETGGTGLGLAIVKHIAVLHHARLELKSRVDQGTDIRVLFPVPRREK